jgi:preprotein translocase subunit Sec63
MPRGSHFHHGHVEQRDLYDDLGLAEGATDADIRRAYRELVLKVHPDKQGDAAEFRMVRSSRLSHVSALTVTLGARSVRSPA